VTRTTTALLLVACLAAGCGGGGGGSKSTGSTGTPSTQTPSDFDFGTNSPLRVSAFGDSITQGELGDRSLRVRTAPRVTSNNYPNNLQAMLRGLDPGWRVVNRGRGGETTGLGRGRLPGVLRADRPGFVLIMEGTNDATRDESAGSIVANLEAMITSAQNNHSVPVVGTIPPNFRPDPNAQNIIAQANPMIRSMARSRGVVLAEIFDGMNDPGLFATPSERVFDPLHPNERGYAVMAGIWYEAMLRAIPAPAAPAPPAPAPEPTPPSGLPVPQPPLKTTTARTRTR
jgi:lysophospholipase L1-like esterase